jgi:hypothetical protein
LWPIIIFILNTVRQSRGKRWLRETQIYRWKLSLLWSVWSWTLHHLWRQTMVMRCYWDSVRTPWTDVSSQSKNIIVVKFWHVSTYTEGNRHLENYLCHSLSCICMHSEWWEMKYFNLET